MSVFFEIPNWNLKGFKEVGMPYFNIVAQTNENTVVTEYEPMARRSDAYQSEAELEKEFIRMLTEQGYTYLQIHD